MKRSLSFFLCVLLILSAFSLSVTAKSADETRAATGEVLEDAPTAEEALEEMTVPQIRVTTENSNGTTLEKEDGYVNAAIVITDTDGSKIEDSILFKVRGNSTALNFVKKKAFTVKFEKKKELFGMGKGKKWALLANCFDPTLMRSYIAFNLAYAMDLTYASQQKIVELWVDDVFRGCYTLMEPVQEGSDRVDIDIESNNGMKDFLIEYEATRVEDDVTYIKNGSERFAVNEPEAPNEQQIRYISGIMSDVLGTIRSGDQAAIEEKIDIESFSKFYLLNEFLKTVDFGYSSVFFYYKDGVLYAGPPWDFDLSSGNANSAFSQSARQAQDPSGLYADKNIFHYLCQYSWFNEAVADLYAAHFDEFESIPQSGGMMDGILDAYGGVFDRNFTDAGWNISKWWINVQKQPLSTYELNVDYLREWYRLRNEWLKEHFNIYTVGDANGDETINIEDVTVIQKLLAELVLDDDGMIFVRGCVNGETLTILDATVIQRVLARLAESTRVGEKASYFNK